MIGAAAGMGILPFSKEIVLALMEAEIPEKHRAVNRAAFEEAVKKIKLISTSQDGKQKVKSNV
jgi:indolepyruvate ferredoxin oxidoreductase beta subunit